MAKTHFLLKGQFLDSVIVDVEVFRCVNFLNASPFKLYLFMSRTGIVDHYSTGGQEVKYQ